MKLKPPLRCLFDLNVIIDVTECRQPFYADSLAVFTQTSEEKIDGFVASGSINDLYYIVRRSRGDSAQALNAIRDILDVLTLANTMAEDVQAALDLPFADFEDAIIAATAEREGLDYIITRNVKDYTNSPVKAINPVDFIKEVFS
jgi:predicted nucleic acid-binding protein